MRISDWSSDVALPIYLLLHVLTILKRHRDVLESYQRRFRYIMVDEYQDTNSSQYLWLRLLAQSSKNICCVGYDDQSIYSWRGAEVANILRFEKDFPGVKNIRLEQKDRKSVVEGKSVSGSDDSGVRRITQTKKKTIKSE